MMDFEATPSNGQIGLESAPQACASCRKQKRKCDKQLPACSLCLRIGRPCDYTAESQPQAPSAEDFDAIRQQVAELQDLLKSGQSSRSNNNSNGSPFPLTSTSNGSNGSLSLGNNSTPNQLIQSDGTPSSTAGGVPVWPQPSSFPSLYFLDSNAFDYERFQIQAPHVRVPPGALTALGSSNELRQMIEHYFATVHTYFPVVSKIRLYQHLANPLHEPGADIALLFLSMKLISEEIPEGLPPQTQLYQDVKSFYHYIEAQNAFSTPTLQALLLIALYEIAQAIYPAAYLSVGAAVRLGYACGLHARNAPQMLPRCTTWTEQEERRRLWWGTIILDRFINIGHRTKPFASNDPGLETHLPTDDESWDRGQMLAAAPLSLSASTAIDVSPYARTCQAAHLLGKVLRHIDDFSIPMEFRFAEALQLLRTTRALADVIPDVAATDDTLAGGTGSPNLCTSMAITYSGLLTLCDTYSCTERPRTVSGEEMSESHLLMQKESIEGLAEFSGRVVQLARRVQEVVQNGGIERLSPLAVDCIYQAAANYAWYVRESSDPASGERLVELKELLRVLERRWRVAGEYYRIVEATEFQLSSAIG